MEVLYCTLKGARHMFARAIAVEFRDRGIRANAICPGFIATAHGLREIEMLGKQGVDVSESMSAAQGRLCRPEEASGQRRRQLRQRRASVCRQRLHRDLKKNQQGKRHEHLIAWHDRQ